MLDPSRPLDTGSSNDPPLSHPLALLHCEVYINMSLALCDLVGILSDPDEFPGESEFLQDYLCLELEKPLLVIWEGVGERIY